MKFTFDSFYDDLRVGNLIEDALDGMEIPPENKQFIDLVNRENSEDRKFGSAVIKVSHKSRRKR